MNYDKDENIIPYEKFGDMLFTGKLTTIRVDYDNGYTIVSDVKGQLWKVTAVASKYGRYVAVLTKMD